MAWMSIFKHDFYGCVIKPIISICIWLLIHIIMSMPVAIPLISKRKSIGAIHIIFPQGVPQYVFDVVIKYDVSRQIKHLLFVNWLFTSAKQQRNGRSPRLTPFRRVENGLFASNLGQYSGCWCTVSLVHQDTRNHLLTWFNFNLTWVMASNRQAVSIT